MLLVCRRPGFVSLGVRTLSETLALVEVFADVGMSGEVLIYGSR